MDGRVSVRLLAPAVRRHRRAGVPRARPRAHADADGAAPHARRRPRSRLQQRQHLRRAVAHGARGTHRRHRVGAAVLRARAQGQRRRAGAPLDDAARRRLHLLVQRRALALRRHHPLAARARPLAPARPPPGRGTGRAGQPPRRGSCSTRRRPHSYNVFYARSGGPFDVRGRVAHESLFNVANGTYRGPEHAAGLLALQHVDARARVGDARLCRAARVPLDAHRRRRPVVGRRGAPSRRSSTRRAPRATSTSTRPRAPMASPTGTPARPGCRRSATGAAATPIRSTIASPSTAPPRPSARRACCASAVSCTRARRATADALHAGRDCACSTRSSTRPART